MKFKYKLGEKVTASVTSFKEEECSTCFHTDTVSFREEVTGKITKRFKERVYFVQGIPITNQTETMPDGSVFHRPYLAPLSVQEEQYELFYNIRTSTGVKRVSEKDIKND